MPPNDGIEVDGLRVGDEVLALHGVSGRIVEFTTIRGAKRPFGPYDTDDEPAAVIDAHELGHVIRETSAIAIAGRLGDCGCGAPRALLVNRVSLWDRETAESEPGYFNGERRTPRRARTRGRPPEELVAVPDPEGKHLNPPCCVACAKKCLVAQEALRASE